MSRAMYMAVVSLMATAAVQEGYFELTSGDACPRITTIDECSRAATSLGFSDNSASDDGSDDYDYEYDYGDGDGVTNDPPYCYFEKGSLKYNSNGQNTGACTFDDRCLCKCHGFTTEASCPTDTGCTWSNGACEAKATCAMFSCLSASKPFNVDASVKCSGDASTCDTNTCCAETLLDSKCGSGHIWKLSEVGGSCSNACVASGLPCIEQPAASSNAACMSQLASAFGASCSGGVFAGRYDGNPVRDVQSNYCYYNSYGSNVAAFCSASWDYYVRFCPCQAPCDQPSTTGYNFNSAEGTTSIDGFALTGVTCASGYTGDVTYAVCTSAGTEYSVSGCKAWTCSTGTSGWQCASCASTLTANDQCATCNDDGYVRVAPLCEAPAPLRTIALRQAGTFALLTKTGVSTTGQTTVTGNMGVSPAASTYLTGFGLTLDASPSEFSTSDLVTGKVYAASYAGTTPAMMTTAISDMEAAYTDAAGRTDPDTTELGAGNIEGKTLTGGVHKWSSSVTFSTSLSFDAGDNPEMVWILQIAQNLVLATGAQVKLLNRAKASNIFWQVAGQAQILAGAHAKGIILCQTAIIFGAGSTLQGRGLAQTAITMIATTIDAPQPQP